MGRIRTIKPEFPQSESMGRVSRDARLTFILIWTLVDDSGRTRASSRLLASLLYPYDDDARGLMDGWLGELAREGCVRQYKVGSDEYLEVPNWLSHQKIDHPSKSKFPAFCESSRILENPLEASENVAWDQGSRIKDQGRDQEGKGDESPSNAPAKDSGVQEQQPAGNGLNEVVIDVGRNRKGKCSIPPESNDDGEKIGSDCTISNNPTHLPDDDTIAINELDAKPLVEGDDRAKMEPIALVGVQDDLQGATPPAALQQEHHEPPTSGKQAGNQPEEVIPEDWPAHIDYAESVKNLIRSHPRPTVGYSAETAVIAQIDLLMRERGCGKWDAYTFLLGRVMAYKAATDEWPADRRSRITGILKFIEGEEYRQDDSIWRSYAYDDSSSDGTGDSISTEAAIRRARQARGAGGGDVRLAPVLGPQELKRAQQAARAGFTRPGFRATYPRPS